MGWRLGEEQFQAPGTWNLRVCPAPPLARGSRIQIFRLEHRTQGLRAIATQVRIRRRGPDDVRLGS